MSVRCFHCNDVAQPSYTFRCSTCHRQDSHGQRQPVTSVSCVACIDGYACWNCSRRAGADDIRMNSSDESSGEQSSADEHSADEPEQEKSLTSAKNLFKPLVQKLEPCSGACHGGEHIRLELQGQVWQTVSSAEALVLPAASRQAQWTWQSRRRLQRANGSHERRRLQREPSAASLN